jgi:hypothetical protein
VRGSLKYAGLLVQSNFVAVGWLCFKGIDILSSFTGHLLIIYDYLFRKKFFYDSQKESLIKLESGVSVWIRITPPGYAYLAYVVVSR